MAGEFGWSKKREQAALLVAEDELSDEEIARECGIGKRTLERWKLIEAFTARVEEHRAAWRERVRAEGIANRQNRVDALNERWALLKQVVGERAAQGAGSAVAGDRTGLLVKSLKVVGNGPGAQVVEEQPTLQVALQPPRAIGSSFRAAPGRGGQLPTAPRLRDGSDRRAQG